MTEHVIMPTTMTVDRFSAVSGLGKTSIYKLIKQGELKSARILGRRLIIMESYFEMVRRQAERETRSRTLAIVRQQPQKEDGI